jgi:isopentenyl phosphate kinase
MVPWRCQGDFTKPFIVKLGGSVITDKRKPFKVRKTVLTRLAQELSKARHPLVVVHGGGSFGHPLAAKYEIAQGYRNEKQLKGFAATHRAMEKLNAEVVEAFRRVGLPAIAIQPSASAVVGNGKLISMELRPLKKLLELGLVPVLYGDAVPDVRRGMSILSGDQLVVYLAKALEASRVIVGVNVDGVYTSDPRKGRAELLRKITPASWSGLSFPGDRGVKDVTGGMENKVMELLSLAKSGIESEIVNANKPGILEKLVTGKRGLGTLIKWR